MKVKIFVGDKKKEVEDNINIWLKDMAISHIHVHNILQSECYSDSLNVWSVTITIFYTKY